MVSDGQMTKKTADFVLGGGDKLGIYYENVKTHIMSEGFPTRGKISVCNAAVEGCVIMWTLKWIL